MAEPDEPQPEPPTAQKQRQKLFKGFNLFSRKQHKGARYAQSETSHDTSPSQPAQRAQSVGGRTSRSPDHDDSHSEEPRKRGERVRTSRSVVPELPRAQTFKRQLSEERSRLAPVEPTLEERRAVSMDRRSHIPLHARNYGYIDSALEDQEISDPGDHEGEHYQSSKYTAAGTEAQTTTDPNITREDFFTGIGGALNPSGYAADLGELEGRDFDNRSLVSSVYHDEERYADMIAHELENSWILNLSMRYKDRSNREKFFVTYRQNEQHWRRVTVTLDYRDASAGSLEEELGEIRSQREKSSKIYEAIRQSLQEIQFYETVTNLKLETTDGRLHVHVVEDVNEIIQFPLMSDLKHLGCRSIKESDIIFDYHMSGFVYKVHVDGVALIKKEIPGPETIDEFLYEINALNSLRYSENVIKFYGLVVDDFEQVKGLLISYADGGALIDVIYDSYKDKNTGIRWSLKERWAHQIVNGLADVHECGFVQGDFTLSNIVIDEHDNAKIIDINRRGCPVGWEPPEATPLIESQHRISMYIGVKSDLFQLGMVLWAIAMGEDEPEREGRPLQWDSNNNVPDWYRQVTDICLSPDPRKRLQACMLLQLFPHQDPHITVEEGDQVHELAVDEFHPYGHPQIRVDKLPNKFWSPERSYSPGTHPSSQPWHFAPRGRSPPSPMPSNYDDSKSPGRFHSRSSWAANRNIRASYSDAGGEEVRLDDVGQEYTPNTSVDRGPLPEVDEDEEAVVKKEEPQVMGFEVVEDAQATPTQEKIDNMAETEPKDGENALQETSGNATRPVKTEEVPDVISLEKNGVLGGLNDALEKKEVVEEGEVTEMDPATPEDLTKHPSEFAPEDNVISSTQQADEKPDGHDEATGEQADTPSIDDSAELPRVNESETKGEELAESFEEDNDDQGSPAREPLPEVTKAAGIEATPIAVEPPAEEAHTGPETVAEEEPNESEQKDQVAKFGSDEEEDPRKTGDLAGDQQTLDTPATASEPTTSIEDPVSKAEIAPSIIEEPVEGAGMEGANDPGTPPKTEHPPEEEVLPEKPDVAADVMVPAEDQPTNTESELPFSDAEKKAPQTSIETEQSPSQSDLGVPPSKDESTPRISPSLEHDEIKDAKLLDSVGGTTASDGFPTERNATDDEFQLVDRPAPTASTTTITADTTT